MGSTNSRALLTASVSLRHAVPVPPFRCLYHNAGYSGLRAAAHSATGRTHTHCKPSHGQREATHMSTLTQTPAWKALAAHQKSLAGRHMRDLFKEDPKRF